MMSVLFNLILLLLIFLELSQCCSFSPYTYKYATSEITKLSNENYPWLVVITGEDPIFKLSYGSIIHPKVVLTSAASVYGIPKNELVVETNCSCISQWSLGNCTSRKVTKVLISPFVLEYEKVLVDNYAFLILVKSFVITQKRNLLTIAGPFDIIDENNCFFTRWMRVYNKNLSEMAVVTVPYKTSFVNRTLDVRSFNRDQLETDRDFIISRAFHYTIIKQNITNENFLNFMGSPLVCRLRFNPRKYVQVGIATFRLRIPITEKNTTSPLKIIQEGSLIRVTGLYHDFIYLLQQKILYLFLYLLRI